MSTRSTIKYEAGKWHLYRDLAEENAIFLETIHTTHTGRTICENVEIPWEVAEALHDVVDARRKYEASLKDPEWLQAEIAKLKEELQDVMQSKSGLRDFLITRVENEIRFFQDKLDELEEEVENDDV